MQQRAAATSGKAKTTLRDPLAPLTEAEIIRAAALVREAHDLGRGMRFETIELAEPAPASRARSSGKAPPRRAFIATYDTATSRLFEAVVDLDKGRLDSWTERKHAFPRIGPDEFLDAEKLALADPRFVKALKRRGITDLSLVCCDPWSTGRGVLGRGESRRLVQTIVWVRKRPDDNQFAHPVEGLCAIIDVNSGEVISVTDEGPARPPMEEHNYASIFQKTWRTDLKPIEVVQPEGPSFTVDGYRVEWGGWRFAIGFTAREGIVLYDLEIRDGQKFRSVLRRASIAEMIVPYGSPYGLHPRKNAFDCGEYGIGAMANSLVLGCDCLGAIHYFDATLNGVDGKPQVIRNAICMHEEDTGILWKHTDFRTQRVDVRRGRKLIISFIATVGNYEYMFYWSLHLDGTIALEVKATGIINTAGIDPPEAVGYGVEVAPGVIGQIHQHLFCARLEMAVDGADNAVVEVNGKLVPEGPANPVGNAFRADETLLETEKSARRSTSTATNRYWKIVNRKRKSRLGHPAAYRLVATNAITALGGPRSQLGRRAGFARHHVWVTPSTDSERWPAGDYVNQSAAGEGLPEWTKADRSVVDRPITVWHVFGLHHLPRPEDFPVQPSVSCGFMLMPDGFFERNPTLDVPPAKSGKSCCV
ncbi:MAG: primary-amine oxidase [Hyphomicrobiaceae bacterium]